MPRKSSKPKAAHFDSDRIDDDELPVGGGIPDDDGMIFLKTSHSKDANRGKSKKGQATSTKAQRSVER